MGVQDGILNIVKPVGISSFGCLKQVKRKLGLNKVGHLGTLDPNACGVLVLLCGKATKLNAQLSGGTKVYRSIFKFGIETDTLDPCGTITEKCDVLPARGQITAELNKLTGLVEIEIPKFSAVHIGGERAYNLARRGVDFTTPKKTVKINRFELLNQFAPDEYFFEIECETGTYVRSLAKALAARLGTVAIASTIIRMRVGQFDIKDAKNPKLVALKDLIKA